MLVNKKTKKKSVKLLGDWEKLSQDIYMGFFPFMEDCVMKAVTLSNTKNLARFSSINQVWKKEQKELCFWIKKYDLTWVSKAICQRKWSEVKPGKAMDDFP